MLTRSVSRWLAVAGGGLALLAFMPESSLAVGDEPKTEKPDPKPKNNQRGLNQDQAYSVGYWQAKGGQYDAALATLRTARDQSDPRIQTMIGFTLRKLGRVDEALGYYERVLTAYPDRTTTRQYLGEAFLQMGNPVKAREQLAEIAKRCGTACEDYQLLADEITAYERTAG
jgi:predicted Zn-dependent protease